MSKQQSNVVMRIPHPLMYTLPVVPVGTSVCWHDISELCGDEHLSGVFKVIQAPKKKDFDCFESLMDDGVYLLSNGYREVEAYRHELTVLEVPK